MGFDKYNEDCIHLHACRLQRHHCKTQFNKQLTMGCNEDCSAYCSGESGDYISVDDALSYARSGVDSIRGGYDGYDVYAACDLSGKTLSEIIEAEEGD